jgi:hypothetical protein
MEEKQPITNIPEGAAAVFRMRHMNLHIITTLVIILGLLLTLFCMVEVEAGYRHVRRYLERNKARGEDSGEQNGG